jgi:hypothetical protein
LALDLVAERAEENPREINFGAESRIAVMLTVQLHLVNPIESFSVNASWRSTPDKNPLSQPPTRDHHMEAKPVNSQL